MHCVTVMVFFILIFFSGSGLSSEIYHWIDEQGIVHYSNELPPANARIIRQWGEIRSDHESKTDTEQNGKQDTSSTSPVEMTGESPDKKPIEEPKEPKQKKDSGEESDSETLQRLKKNLKTRTSSDQQRKLQRRIKALESKENVESKPAEESKQVD
ncbi:MAG: DUF4124 domain-containing protein [Pseudomonadota bacterium]